MRSLTTGPERSASSSRSISRSAPSAGSSSTSRSRSEPRALPTHRRAPSGVKANACPPSSFANSATTRNSDALVVAHQQLVVAGRRLRPRRPQEAVAVGEPADDVAGVAGHEPQPAGGEREPVGVEDGAVAQVHRHQDVTRAWPAGRRSRPARTPGNGVRSRARPPVAGTARMWWFSSPPASCDQRMQPRVARPQVGAHAAVAVVGDGPGLAARAVAHPDVQDAVARGEPGERAGRRGRGARAPARGRRRGRAGGSAGARRPSCQVARVARPPGRDPVGRTGNAPSIIARLSGMRPPCPLHEEPPVEVERPAVRPFRGAQLIALLFPGQGAQQVGMGRALADAFPTARRTFEEANDVLGYDLARLCFEGPAEDLTSTRNCQPAILTSSVAAWRVAHENGVDRRHRHGPLPGRVLGAGGLRQPDLRGGPAPGAGARRRHHRRLGGDARADGGAAGRQRRGRRGHVPRGRRGVAGQLQQPRPDRRLGPAPRRRPAAGPRPRARASRRGCWTSTARSTRP